MVINMKSYENCLCPVCKSRLFDDDDIVVCPVCGTPHHRDCYNFLKHCAHEDEHGSFVFEEPEKETEQPDLNNQEFNPEGKDRVGHVCPQCKRPSTSDILFCPYCGYSFEEGKPRSQQDSPFMPNQMPFAQPFIPVDPYGGVDPSETIDGLPVSDVVKFVAVNTKNYLPKFFRFSSQKKKSSWNWSAFLVPELWLFFRKCYKEGFFISILLLISTVLCAPFSIKATGILNKFMENSATADSAKTLMDIFDASTLVAIICFFAGLGISIAVRVFCAVFADYFYKKHTVSGILKIRTDEEAEEPEMLFKIKGGVNLFAPIVAYSALNFITFIIQSNFI